MSPGLRERLIRLRGFVSRDDAPRLADESRWYTEHTALLISTLKWALLGAAAGVCVVDRVSCMLASTGSE